MDLTEPGTTTNKRKKQFLDVKEKKQKATAQKIRPCSFFAVGKCTRGSDCRFSHDEVVEVPVQPVDDPTKLLVDDGKPYTSPPIPQPILDLFREKIAEYAIKILTKELAFQDAELKELDKFLDIQDPGTIQGLKRPFEEYLTALKNSWATKWQFFQKIVARWSKVPNEIPLDKNEEPLFTVDAVRDLQVSIRAAAKKRKKIIVKKKVDKKKPKKRKKRKKGKMKQRQ